MDRFWSSEVFVMGKAVENGKGFKRTKPEDVGEVYEISRIVSFLDAINSKTVCLQFPDHMLPDSYEVVTQLKRASNGAAAYVMADSNYESCCVDYVTAQHVNADAIVHFGPRCFSAWEETIPCLCIYEKAPMDVNGFVEKLQEESLGRRNVFLKMDTPYLHLETDVTEALKGKDFNVVDKWKDDGVTINVYVGENNRNLLNYQLKERVDALYYFDPTTTILAPYNLNNYILRRRNFLIEKVRDSQRVGIVIGTLVIKNFLRAIERVKTLLKLHGKKYYVLSVGRPTVTKLANFPEMDVYVLVCCPSSSVFESRDFFKPIVTLYDVEAALNTPSDNVRSRNFTYGIEEDLLEGEIDCERVDGPEMSLISGDMRWRDTDEQKVGDGMEIAVKDKGIVALAKNSGAEFLAGRTFRGLEQKLGETEVSLAVEGRKGTAESYENELF